MTSTTKAARTLIFGLLLTITFPAEKVTAEQNSWFKTRCNTWNSLLDDFDQWIYMAGLIDGLLFNDLAIQGIGIPERMSTEDVVQNVNWICKDPANLRIPIPFVFKVAAMRAHGMNRELILRELAALRAQFSEN